MYSWFFSLSASQIGNDKKYSLLTHENRLLNHAGVLMSESASMEKRFVNTVIQHINKFLRRCVKPEHAYFLTLDANSSRNGEQ